MPNATFEPDDEKSDTHAEADLNSILQARDAGTNEYLVSRSRRENHGNGWFW